MAEAPSPDVRGNFQDLARQLRGAHHLGPEAQQALAELVEELGQAFPAGEGPPAEMTHLAESTAHVVEALRQQDETGLLGAARERLERATVAAETRAPVAAGVARRLVDALANLGI